MDHIKVLKRAFKITWNYKALWVFGIILALTVAGSRGSSSPGSPPGQYELDERDFQRQWEMPGGEEIPWAEIFEETLPWLAIGAIALGGCCCLALVIAVVRLVLRYVAETALIRMVDKYEETDEKHSIREGFRMGWSQAAFRLFLIDLVTSLASLVIFMPLIILMLALLGLSIFMFVRGTIIVGIIGSIAFIGLLFLIIFFSIIVGAVIGVLKPFFHRGCVLEDLGVGDSLANSVEMVKRHFAWDVAVMWLIVIGLNIGWFVAMIIVGLLLFVIALFIAAVPALMLGGLSGLIFGWVTGLIVGGVAGGLVLVVLLVASTTFLEGLRMTFLSTLWTLTYRELRALEGMDETEEPAASDSDEVE
jgi:hypothetical protein